MGDTADMKFVLFLESSEEVMIERIKGRAAKAEEAGEAVRVDDNVEAAQKRFKTFREQSMPIVDSYTSQDKVKKIDATGT